MVKMSEQKNMAPDSSLASKGFNINPLDILRFLLSKWYWFVLSIALFGGWAWYKYSTTQFRYTTNATVMFKDAHASARQAGLDRLANATPQVNISNEILQFQSPELMRKAILRLHAEIDYTIMDYLRVEELYSNSPIKVSFLDVADDQTATLQVTPIDDQKVRLAGFTTGGPLTAPLGKTVRTPLGKLSITKTLFYNKEWFGRTINVKKNDINVTVGNICPNLTITQGSADAGMSYGYNSSSILYMYLSDVNPTRAEDILNTLIDIYNEETISDKNQIAINTSNFIDERLAIIEKELGGVEAQIQNYKESHNMVDLGSVTSQAQSQRERYSTEVKDLLLQQQTGQYLRDYLRDPSKATDLIPTNTGVSNGAIEEQINQYNKSKLRRDKLLEGGGGENNPVIEDLNSTLNSMRQNILRSVDNMNANISAKIEDVANRAGQASARMSQIPKQQRQMLSIERQQHIKEELYLYLLNKREENALSLATTESNARVLQPAYGNKTPISPIFGTMMTKNMAMAVGLPLATLLFLFFFDTRVKSRKDIEDMTSVPFIGEIPKHSFSKNPLGKSQRIVVLNDSRDITSEAFRIVRTNMDFMRVKAENLQVVTFSSFGASAGKTFVSSNLAASFAQTGKKVIIIDLDIRKGTLTIHTKHHQEKGMTNYLSGQAELDDIIKHDDICENLDIIPAGGIAPNPAELLLSDRLDKMVDELRTRYDYILIDNVPTEWWPTP